jgi:hypothetical protein
MSTVTKTNEPPSEPTSPSGQRPHEPAPDRENLSEREFLEREIVDAQAALASTAEDLKASLRKSLDLRLWCQHYPWATLAATAAGGFAAAVVLVPEKGETLAGKWSRLAPRQAAEETAAVEPDRASEPTQPAVSAIILGGVFGLARLLLETWIREALTPAAASKTKNTPQINPTARTQKREP